MRGRAALLRGAPDPGGGRVRRAPQETPWDRPGAGREPDPWLGRWSPTSHLPGTWATFATVVGVDVARMVLTPGAGCVDHDIRGGCSLLATGT